MSVFTAKVGLILLKVTQYVSQPGVLSLALEDTEDIFSGVLGSPS